MMHHHHRKQASKPPPVVITMQASAAMEEEVFQHVASSQILQLAKQVRLCKLVGTLCACVSLTARHMPRHGMPCPRSTA